MIAGLDQTIMLYSYNCLQIEDGKGTFFCMVEHLLWGTNFDKLTYFGL